VTATTRARWLGPVALAAIATMSSQPATGAPLEVVVDRTFRCTPLPLVSGLRDLDIATAPRGTILPRGSVRAPSTGYVGTGSGTDDFGSDLVAVRARSQVRYEQRPLPPGVSDVPLPPGVYASVRRCVATRASVALSPTGLPGPPVAFETDDACAVRGRVLVRVLAVLQSPAPWRRQDRQFVGARRNVVEAAIAVRNVRTRRPIAFMRLGRSGTTKLWSSRACG
jgi:hypothetical protein